MVENKEENVKRRKNLLQDDIEHMRNHLLVLHEKLSNNEAKGAEIMLPISWTEHFSPKYGVPFYYNKTRAVISWTYPFKYMMFE